MTRMEEVQSCGDHPDKLTNWSQVLRTEGRARRCYWEVEMSAEEWSGWQTTRTSAEEEVRESIWIK